MALITKISEINHIYPTSKWDKIEALQAPLEKVERTKLVRLLGQPLFDQIVTDYQSSLIPKPAAPSPAPGASASGSTASAPVPDASASGQDTPGSYSPTASDFFKFDVIRTCQEIELYIMLSNNIRILSLSLNRGGGFNALTADGYDTPEIEQLNELKKETWHNAMDSIEHLLLLLEQDAETNRIYSELWKKSRYYYHHKDLLFTTAVDMQEYYNIDESRERFIQLIPTVRNCQEIYIGTRIGTSLLRTLVALDASSPEYDSLSEIKSLVKQALSQYVDAEIAMSPAEAAKVTAKGMETIRQQRSDSHLNGDRLIALAIQQILLTPDTYSQYITKGSPLAYEYRQANGEDYLSPAERQALAEAQAQLTAGATDASASTKSCSCYQQSQDDQDYDALCDLGGMHLM